MRVEAHAEADLVEATMLQRTAILIFGAIILGLSASAIALNLANGERIETSVLVFSAAFTGAAVVCFWAALAVDTQEGPFEPVQPSPGAEAAWRLRELKRTAPSRYPGLKGLSRLAPWKM